MDHLLLFFLASALNAARAEGSAAEKCDCMQNVNACIISNATHLCLFYLLV